MIRDLNRPKTFSGRRASMEAGELARLLELFAAEQVRSYGEIGAREGDTFHAVMSSLPAGSVGVALDYPGGHWGHEGSRQRLERVVTDLNGKGYAASCMFGDSTTAACVRQFAMRGPYDAIFIDGDHRLAGVTADWQNYRSLARIVAFHDIDGAQEKDKTGATVDVPILWASIKAASARTMEFLTPGSHMGIGVVWTA